MSTINVSGSYVQDKRFTNVSDKFNVVQPSMVGQAMSNQGLQLVSLSTGKAKQADKVDFQRTLSRYRGPEIGDGVFLDVVYDSKHMGRGSDRILLGIYRMICTNGLFVGMNMFKHSVRHNGETFESLDQGIAAALNAQTMVAKAVERMQKVELTFSQREVMANEAVKLLTPSNTIEATHRLLQPRREVDAKTDLWTTYNVIQENAMRGGINYKLPAIDMTTGIQGVREMHTRAIKANTGKDADFNQKLFEIAEQMAA